jgi:hypothetical protein
MRLLHLPDELLRHVLLHCTLSTLRRLKQACAQLRGEGRSMLRSAAWQATAHGAELGQPAWQGQAAGRPINAGHMDCFGEWRGWFIGQGINAIVRCGQHLMVLTTGHTSGFIRLECDSKAGFNARNPTPLMVGRAIIGQGSWPQACAADDKHVYVLHNGTEFSGTDTDISSFVYADVLSPTNEYECSASTPGPSSSLAGIHAVASKLIVLPRFAIDGDFTRLRASCADERLYVACSYSQCVVVLSTTDLSQLMVFDASRATPAEPVAEQAALGAPTVGVGADELEVIGEERGEHVPMGIAVGEHFVFVAQRACVHGEPDCVAVYHKGTGELSHAIELHDLGVHGLEAVAVHHETLYVLSTGLDERIAGAHHTGQPAPPANAAHDVPLRQPLLSWMGLRGERRGPEQQVSLLPDGYGGEVVRVAHGSLYVDGLRDTLIVTLDADHELGGHSLCIPLSLGGASII